MSRPTQSIHPHVFVRYWTHSDQMESVHMSERSARSLERKRKPSMLAVQECVAVPIEQYRAIRALHEIVYALEEFQNVGLVLTPAAVINLSDDARQLYLARLKQLHDAKPTATEMAVAMREDEQRKAQKHQSCLEKMPDAPDQSAQNPNQAPYVPDAPSEWQND